MAEVLKDKQPKQLKKLNKGINESKQNSKKKRFSQREVEELMSHSAYKCCGRAIRQIRQSKK